jgi:hypothetical protein
LSQLGFADSKKNAKASWLNQLGIAKSKRICAIPSWLSQLGFADSKKNAKASWPVLYSLTPLF